MPKLLTAASGCGIQRDVYDSKDEPQRPTVKPGTADTEANLALYFRAKWMRAMGVPEAEILEFRWVGQVMIALLYGQDDRLPAELGEVFRKLCRSHTTHRCVGRKVIADNQDLPHLIVS